MLGGGMSKRQTATNTAAKRAYEKQALKDEYAIRLAEISDREVILLAPPNPLKLVRRNASGAVDIHNPMLAHGGLPVEEYVFDAVWFVYTCRRLIDLTLFPGTATDHSARQMDRPSCSGRRIGIGIGRWPGVTRR